MKTVIAALFMLGAMVGAVSAKTISVDIWNGKYAFLQSIVGTATFSYDETLLSGVGVEAVSPLTDASFTLKFYADHGDLLGAVNINDYSETLTFSVKDGTPYHLSLSLVDGVNGIAFPTASNIRSLVVNDRIYPIYSAVDEYAVVGAVSSVPLPAGGALLAAAVGFLTLRRRFS